MTDACETPKTAQKVHTGVKVTTDSGNKATVDILKSQKIFCKNFLSATLQPDSVDLVICDPPYGHTHNKWDQKLDLDKLFKQFDNCCKDRAVVVIFTAGKLTGEILNGPWKKYYRYDLIWAKNKVRGFLNANRMPLRAHETILVFYKKAPSYHTQMNTPRIMGKGGGNPRKRTATGNNYGNISNQSSERYNKSDRYPTSVLPYACVNESKALHPTQKPVPLIEFLVRSFTEEGDVVLDPTCGSGTTGVACKNQGRAFLGFEIDPDNYSTAVNRLKIHCQ